MIFPAVFATGKDPASGPPLLFEVLPDVFAQMPLGTLVAVVFFVLLSIAALTSTVSLLEVVVAYFVDERRWRRRIAVWVVGAIVFVVGLPSVLSQGANKALSEMTVLGNTSFLFIMDFFWGNLSLAIGAFFLSIFVGWVWTAKRAGAELHEGSSSSDGWVRIWGFFVRWVCPVVILIVMLSLFNVFGE
jgi:NSS family neurotransmitter:Na+ symporter